MAPFRKWLPWVAGVSAALMLTACTSGRDQVAKYMSKAEKGDVESMVKIAEIYCGAQNIDQDDQVCGMWLRRASEKGHKRSQYMLGRMYEMGLGMRADPVQAYKWYTLSSKQEYHMAASGAERVAQGMSAAQKAEAEKLVAEALAKGYGN